MADLFVMSVGSVSQRISSVPVIFDPCQPAPFTVAAFDRPERYSVVAHRLSKVTQFGVVVLAGHKLVAGIWNGVNRPIVALGPSESDGFGAIVALALD